MKHFIVTILLFQLSFSLFSQRGKDGVGNITVAGTIVNAYTSVTANMSAGAMTVPVASSSGLNPGDLVFIIQMQGVAVNAGKDTIYPDVSSSLPTNNTFGNITNYYNTGNNEFAEVNSVPNSTSIVLDCGLQKNYSLIGNVQVIKVPRYTTLTVSGAGYITCPAWNGTTGGIVLVEVQGNTTLSSTPSFSVTGKGFRGGGVEDQTTFGGNKYGSINPMQGGYKGESICGDTNRYKTMFSGVFARGAVANGGGGGDAHNAGGGGGANGGSLIGYDGYGNTAAGYAAAWNLESAGFATHTSPGGGRGGYTFSASNQNVTTKAPGNVVWGGDSRENVGGLGGRPLDYSTGRLFLGGGGGTGDSNDGYAVNGGNGGGMVYVLCYGNLSGAGTIVADGATALNTVNTMAGCSGKDGASGGGGGGTIVLNIVGTTALTAATPLSAKGGNGGNMNFGPGCTSTEAYGPGGGGGGGYIAVSGTLPANNIAGGANGIVTGNLSNIAANFPPNGATSGGGGSTGTISTPTLAVSNQTICTNQAATLTAASSNTAATINWYSAAAGGTITASGASYVTPTYTAAGTYTVYAGSCPGTYRLPVIITVNSGLNITANSPTICAGQTTTLTASGATSYTWTPGGATTSSIVVTPTTTTSYTINGTNSSCSGTATTAVTVISQPTITVASTTICIGNTATLTASGATNYTWAPGGQTTTSVAVSPTVNTTYSVTGTNGSCTNTTTAIVNVTSTPTISVASVTICPSQTATLTASGASTYTWSPGSVTGSTYTVAPASNSTYTVIGTSASCTAQATASVTISPGTTITVNSPTICAGQTTTLTASGAISYTWSPGGATTSSITTTPPSTAVYTINATGAGSCSTVQTATVTVLPLPVIAVADATICVGNSATLTASGATNYTWMPGGQTTSSVVANPTVNTTYSITGSNGSCTNTTTATVSVTPTPTISVASVTICPSQTATLTATGANSYTWNPGSVTGSTYTVTPAGNSTYTVIGTSASCTTQVTASVTIGSSISMTVNSPTICSGQSTTLTAAGAATYTWNPSGITSNTILVNPSVTTTYTVNGSNGTCNGTSTGTVSVVSPPTLLVTATNGSGLCQGQTSSLAVSGANTYTWSTGSNNSSDNVTPLATTVYSVIGQISGCSSIGSVTVTVIPSPTVTANSISICTGQTATLTASGASSYTWSPGNVTGSTFTVTPATSSTYTVIGTSSSCTAQATASVTVGSSISIAVNNATICAGQNATLTASGAATYTWSPSGVNTNTLLVNPSVTTTYTVNGSSGTCGGTNTSLVVVNPAPTLTVTATAICPGATSTLTASGATTYTWSTGAVGSTQTVSPSSAMVYSVTGQAGGCTATSTINVTVFPAPVVSFDVQGGNTVSTGSTLHFDNNSSGVTVYTWLFCNGDTTNVANPTYVLADTGTCCITLTGVSSNHCISKHTECVNSVVGATVSIPNVFTPNGDNVNEVFKISSSGLKDLHVAIFDRWGLKMYEWDGIGGYWDGKSRSGVAVPSGTYFYVLNYTDLKDKTTNDKGFLSLIKD